jgi:hypothetical protein
MDMESHSAYQAMHAQLELLEAAAGDIFVFLFGLRELVLCMI